MTSPLTIGCRHLWAVAACLLGSLSFVPASHAELIKIGAPIPITGPYSSDGGVMDRGERLAIDELKRREDSGSKARIFCVRHRRFDTDKLQAAATDLVERKNVQVLINGYGGMGPDIPAFCPYPIPYINNDATSNVVELMEKMKCKSIFMGLTSTSTMGGSRSNS